MVILLLELARSKALFVPDALSMAGSVGHVTKNCYGIFSYTEHHLKLAAFGLFSKWVVVAYKKLGAYLF